MAITTVAVGGGLASVMALYSQRDRLYYHPSTELATSPRHIGLEYEDAQIFYHTPNPPRAVYVHGWWVPAKTPAKPNESSPTIIHCHGNAGNIGDRLPFLDLISKFLPECNVLLFDYPGFGRSGSSDVKPTTEDCHQSTEQAFKWVVADRGIPAENIILWGESIGCVFATALASRLVRQPAGILLQTPFTDMSDMVRHHYTNILGLLPSLLVRKDHNTIGYIEQVAKKSTPIVMLHAPEDEIVPYWMAHKLRRFATSYADLSGTHNSPLHEDGENIAYLVRYFLMT